MIFVPGSPIAPGVTGAARPLVSHRSCWAPLTETAPNSTTQQGGEPPAQVFGQLIRMPVAARSPRSIPANGLATYRFARVSDMADSSPEAVDLTEAELVREVLAAERRRLFERASPRTDTQDSTPAPS